MKKSDIAKELLKNSTTKYIEGLISVYVSKMEDDIIFENSELLRLNSCIEYISEKNLDITGWELRDIPIFYSHCFINEKEKKAFDLAVWDIGEVIPRYLDDGFNEQDSNTIEEAIKQYNTNGYFK